MEKKKIKQEEKCSVVCLYTVFWSHMTNNELYSGCCVLVTNQPSPNFTTHS